MDNFQKIEFVLLLVVLVLTLGMFVSSNNSISGFFVSEDFFSPSDFISNSNIQADKESVKFFINNPVLSRYEDSNSMVPVLDKGATGVGFKPNSIDEIGVGDIVSFWQDEKLIVHRVIEKGVDELGSYLITKGDNNSVDDGKIRFEQIDSVLVAIIY